MRYALIGLVCLLPALAQDIRFPASLEKLAAKAEEVVDVTLDSSMLQLASRFLSDRDPDEAHAKRLVTGLKGIYVRSFQFANSGEYSPADVESVRSQLQAPAWARVVTVRSRKSGDNADVYIKTESGQITGLTVIASEPKELTIVNIVGNIRPEDLRDLGGKFGLPKMDDVVGAPKSTGKKDE